MPDIPIYSYEDLRKKADEFLQLFFTAITLSLTAPNPVKSITSGHVKDNSKERQTGYILYHAESPLY